MNISIKYFKRSLTESVQNATVEERVSLLEVQVSDLREDLTTVTDNVEEVEGEINFLFSEQVIQDERLLNLEVEVDDFEDDIIDKF